MIRKLFALLLLIAGLVLAGLGFRTISDALASSSWPMVQGTIVESRVDEVRRSKPPKQQVKQSKFRPVVDYEYSVNTESYTSSRVQFGETLLNSKQAAETAISSYPAGQVVNVYYKPSAPKSAVLQPGMNFQSIFYPAIGVILILIGLPLLFKRRR